VYNWMEEIRSCVVEILLEFNDRHWRIQEFSSFLYGKNLRGSLWFFFFKTLANLIIFRWGGHTLNPFGGARIFEIADISFKFENTRNFKKFFSAGPFYPKPTPLSMSVKVLHLCHLNFVGACRVANRVSHLL